MSGRVAFLSTLPESIVAELRPRVAHESLSMNMNCSDLPEGQRGKAEGGDGGEPQHHLLGTDPLEPVDVGVRPKGTSLPPASR